MRKNIVLAIGLICLLIPGVYAQQDFDAIRKQMEQEFNAFKKEKEQEFEDFRAEANANFAEFMSRSWQEFQTYQGIPAPKSDEPAKQPVAKPVKTPTADPLPVVTVTPVPEPTPRPKPVAPIKVPATTPEPTPEPATTPTPSVTSVPISPKPVPETTKPGFSFLFYNTDCKVSLDNSLRFSLSDVSEKNMANAWKTLSGKQYNALIADCLKLRDQLNLSDWGYMLLLKTISEDFLGKNTNEAVLWQMFILTQSGYKVRLARTDNRLTMLIPFRETIYEYVYLNVDGVRYYVIDKDLRGKSLYMCDQQFPKEQYFSWQTELPKLTEKLNSPKTFTSARYPEIQAAIQTNQNLLDYFNDYPLSSEFGLYAFTGLSETVKQSLYPALQKVIAKKSKTEAAGVLLNFLQTTFAYKTDAEQFGHERPFFADESFFFPYNNCKDRAVLYSILVRELLGLDVVLLLYPGHLATAVHFPEDLYGDYLTIDGKKFLVCDPTYIGAGIGRAMPNCKSEQAKVIRLS